MDFGKQEHVFTPLQKRLFPAIDKFLDVTDDDVQYFIETSSTDRSASRSAKQQQQVPVVNVVISQDDEAAK